MFKKHGRKKVLTDTDKESTLTVFPQFFGNFQDFEEKFKP